MELEEVRALVRSNRPAPGAGYAEPVRQAVVAYTQQRRAEGQRWEQIGTTLGLSGTTLSNWSRAQGQFLPVAVVERHAEALPVGSPVPTTSSGLVLHTPAGFRLEGLDLPQALALLQALR